MLFFVHIPKTAGVSVFDALRRVVPRAKFAWHTNADTIPSKLFANRNFRQTTSVYGGHFGYINIRPFLTPEDTIYAVIREPVERVLSLYNHITMRDLKHPLREEIKGRPIIAATENSPRFLWEISNGQCWYLSGIKKYEDTRRIIKTNQIKVFTMYTLDSLLTEISADLHAKEPPKIGYHNVAETDYRLQATQDEIDFIRNINQEDLDLFRFITEPSIEPV